MKKHLYFIPGTAANSKIFERIELPKDQFEMHFLEWIVPASKDETIEAYAKRFSEGIIHENPILLGVSFGGIMAQEVSKIIPTEKTILISSIKTKHELSKRLRFIRTTRLYKLFPSNSINTIENILKFLYGEKANKRIRMYQNYLSQRSPLHLNWAIKQALHWNQNTELKNILHIHGDKDPIFPSTNIRNFTLVKGGSHIMIVTKAKKISQIILSSLS
jgi:pimeloyl-ACP methyl ester carboxylesterase